MIAAMTSLHNAVPIIVIKNNLAEASHSILIAVVFELSNGGHHFGEVQLKSSGGADASGLGHFVYEL
jgi:hypothetical protein